MAYQLTVNANAVLDLDSGHMRLITSDEYVTWLSLGNTPLPADPMPAPTQDQLDVAAAKAYAKLTALQNMTPAQVQGWITTNVTTLPQAIDTIKTLAIAVSILFRRLP